MSTVYRNVRDHRRMADGTDEVEHLETNSGQVLTLHNGNVDIDLQTRIFDGEVVENQSLNNITKSGEYLIRNANQMPPDVQQNQMHRMKVSSVGENGTVQKFHDHITGNTHTRYRNGSTWTSWSTFGASSNAQFATITSNIGNMTTLQTTNRNSLVAAVNEVRSMTAGGLDAIEDIDARIEEITSRNLDDTFLRLDGLKTATGNITFSNNRGIGGLTTGGNTRWIGWVGTDNSVTLGDTASVTHVNAQNHNLFVSNGEVNHRVFHQGFNGQEANINAWRLAGHAANLFPRTNNRNTFTEQQRIHGNELVMQNSRIHFDNDAGTMIGRIRTVPSGMYLRGAGNEVRIQNGEVFTTQGGFVINNAHTAPHRNFTLRRGTSDNASFHMWLNREGNFQIVNQTGANSWRTVFNVNRSNHVIDVPTGFSVTGRRLWIQPSAPANPVNGDVWIRTSS